ncbi:ABC transporter substrate-binding protein [Sporosarcina sp. Te-1]|uniref:ABC transporter substrate-binding protein n=1 Tax=Sporosarcina sp. Te-1 TaxID=2818390 RepID=UPI001A9E6727|nr:extracellular solute-binding protein [Sporosarcina sp. Te-1]QTD41043.1 extracellular solute-binding protein [Sporosarcina sp. Te-1]
MKKNLVLYFVLLLAGIFLLAACSEKEGEAGKEAASNNGETKEKDPVELLMYSWRPEDREAYEKFIKEFENQNPGIKVTFKPYKSTEYGTILTNTLTAGQGPDIIQLRPYEGATSIIDADYIVPLDDVEGISDISDEYLKAAKGEDGKVYGVPLSLNAAVVFYNKDVFEEHGFKVPETWDDLLAVAEEMKAKDIIPIAQAGKASYLLSLTHSVFGATTYGQEFVNELLEGKVDLTDERFVESVERIQQLESLFPKDFIALEDKDAQAMFYTGQAAMYINGSYRLETFENTNPDMNIGILPSFADKEGGETPLVTWVDGSYAVVKASKHQEEAKKFMEFLASKEFGQMFSDELARISAIPGVDPKHELVREMTELGEENPTPYLMLVYLGGGSPTTKTTFENALQGMYIDSLTVEGVIEESQKSMDKWFKPTN